MRRTLTEPERRLWMALRDSRLEGAKLRRQAVIGRRIVDFFCPARGLVIEVDGETHDSERDRLRDARMLRDHGFRTQRFMNAQVMRGFEGVVLAVALALRATPERWARGAGAAGTTPRPPPLKRRGGARAAPEAPSSSEEGVGGGEGPTRNATR